jgi:hypothetical protein
MFFAGLNKKGVALAFLPNLLRSFSLIYPKANLLAVATFLICRLVL